MIAAAAAAKYNNLSFSPSRPIGPFNVRISLLMLQHSISLHGGGQVLFHVQNLALQVMNNAVHITDSVVHVLKGSSNPARRRSGPFAICPIPPSS